MKWSVSRTQVGVDNVRKSNLTTGEVYSFIAQTGNGHAIPAEIAHRLYLDLVTTGQANFGVYQFAASASD